MKYHFPTKNKEIIKIELFDENDIIIINEPDNIIAFQSSKYTNREDFIFDKLKIKKYKKKSKIYGMSSIYVKSKNNSSINIFELNKNIPFIFNFNILFYTKDIDIKLSIEDIGKVFFKENIFRYECNGQGLIGYYVEGDIIEIILSKDETIFINPKNVVGYDKNIKYEFKTYGNVTAAIDMEYHYKFTGKGRIILQTQSLENDIKQINTNTKDNIIKKSIKEFIPGANLLLK
jgi:uncharacterized protein (AIM24 family)